MSDKPVTVRLEQSRLRDLMALSIVDETNLAKQIRVAVDNYIEARLADPDLGKKAAAAREKQTSVLASLIDR